MEINVEQELNNTILETGLPPYLQKDIDAFIEGEKVNSSIIDCLWCELYGSINSAFWSFQITDEQANYLRKKYLFE